MWATNSKEFNTCAVPMSFGSMTSIAINTSTAVIFRILFHEKKSDGCPRGRAPRSARTIPMLSPEVR